MSSDIKNLWSGEIEIDQRKYRHMRIDRYYNKPTFGKTPKFKSSTHLDWIRGRPCIATGSMSDIDAHHVLRRSQGENDYLTVPLRHDIHMRGHTEGFDQVEGEFAIDIKDAMIACLVERMQELEEELKRCKRKR